MRPRGRGILIVGATSGIAREMSRHLARPGDRFALTSRNPSDLVDLSGELEEAGVDSVHQSALDMYDLENCASTVEWANEVCAGLDLIFVSPGLLPDQKELERHPERLEDCLQVNLAGPAVVLLAGARMFEKRGTGVLAAVSSVAGDRGRPKNYIYGAGKSALDTLLEGLDLRLRPSGIRVINFKPGPVRTGMISHLPRSPLMASAERVGRAMAKRLDGKAGVAYVPWYWRPIMWVICALPRTLLARLRDL